MKYFRKLLIPFCLLLASSPLWAQTFNAVEKEKGYKAYVTGLPSEFEEEEIDDEEAALYNQNYQEQINDGFEIYPENLANIENSERRAPAKVKSLPIKKNSQIQTLREN